MLKRVKHLAGRVMRLKRKNKIATCYQYCERNIRGADGLEIGGPSKFFSKKGGVPIYQMLGTLDNYNYSDKTVWKESQIDDKSFCVAHNKPVKQFISEATSLDDIRDGQYDFVISSHVIEHIANPILAVKEWWRVTREKGYLLIVIPDKEKTFDHRRPVTTMAHLIADYNGKVEEDDGTHFDEILELHDYDYDPESGTYDEFKKRLLLNYEYRCAHHHVFDLLLAVNMVEYGGFKVMVAERFPFCHIVIVAIKA